MSFLTTHRSRCSPAGRRWSQFRSVARRCNARNISGRRVDCHLSASSATRIVVRGEPDVTGRGRGKIGSPSRGRCPPATHRCWYTPPRSRRTRAALRRRRRHCRTSAGAFRSCRYVKRSDAVPSNVEVVVEGEGITGPGVDLHELDVRVPFVLNVDDVVVDALVNQVAEPDEHPLPGGRPPARGHLAIADRNVVADGVVLMVSPKEIINLVAISMVPQDTLYCSTELTVAPSRSKPPPSALFAVAMSCDLQNWIVTWSEFQAQMRPDPPFRRRPTRRHSRRLRSTRSCPASLRRARCHCRCDSAIPGCRGCDRPRCDRYRYPRSACQGTRPPRR